MSKKAVNAPSAEPRRSPATRPTTISASDGNSIEKPTPTTIAPHSAANSECASAMTARPTASSRPAVVAVRRAPARSGTWLSTNRLANTATANAVNTPAPPPIPRARRCSTTNPASAAYPRFASASASPGPWAARGKKASGPGSPAWSRLGSGRRSAISAPARGSSAVAAHTAS